MNFFVLILIVFLFFIPSYLKAKKINFNEIKKIARLALSDLIILLLIIAPSVKQEYKIEWELFLWFRFGSFFYLFNFANSYSKIAIIYLGLSLLALKFLESSYAVALLFLVQILILILFFLMKHQKFPFLRALMHSFCTYALIGILIPQFMIKASDSFLPTLGEIEFSFFSVSTFFLSLVILCLSLQAFSYREGTPDPSDAPEDLVNTGIYRYLRHPLQVAHVLWVFTWVCLWSPQASWLGRPSLIFYAFFFFILHVFILRPIEEQFLLKRFSGDAVIYFKNVKAYGLI